MSDTAEQPAPFDPTEFTAIELDLARQILLGLRQVGASSPAHLVGH
jgi:hypothetical protein